MTSNSLYTRSEKYAALNILHCKQIYLQFFLQPQHACHKWKMNVFKPRFFAVCPPSHKGKEIEQSIDPKHMKKTITHPYVNKTFVFDCRVINLFYTKHIFRQPWPKIMGQLAAFI